MLSPVICLQDVAPKGVVNLRGAIVTLSKRVKMAIEIETGSLITEKSVDKRTYVFTPVMTESINLPEELKKEQRRKDKENLDNWYHWLQVRSTPDRAILHPELCTASAGTQILEHPSLPLFHRHQASSAITLPTFSCFDSFLLIILHGYTGGICEDIHAHVVCQKP